MYNKQIGVILLSFIMTLSVVPVSAKTVAERLQAVESELDMSPDEAMKTGDRLAAIEEELGIDPAEGAALDARLAEVERQVGLSDPAPSTDATDTQSKGFGTLTGTITYYYNDYKGHVADTESTVLLIPDEAQDLDIRTSGLIGTFDIDAKYSMDLGPDVYWVQTNGMGTYSLSHIPEGDYLVLIVSGQTKGQGWFDATNDGETKPSFFEGIASGFGDRLQDDDALALAEEVRWAKYRFDKVSIYAGETSYLDYDFGMTYI